MTDKMNENKFSYYKSPVYNNKSEGTVTTQELFDLVKGDTFKEVTEYLRSLPVEEYMEQRKKKLHFVTPCGEFPRIGRKPKDLVSPSGLLIIDIDHILALGRSVDEIRSAVMEDKEIGLRLIFVSPSGNGLKLFCRSRKGFTDKESYAREWDALSGYLNERFSLPVSHTGIDPNMRSITSCCNLCHDPEAVLIEDGREFDSERHPVKVKTVEKPARDFPTVQDGGSDDIKFWVDHTLHPVMFPYIDLIFPDMEFKRTGKGWESRYKFDGSDPKANRKDKTVITCELPNVAHEQGEEKSYRLIDLYMMKNNLTFAEAVKEVCKICGIDTIWEEQKQNRAYFQPMNGKDTQFTAPKQEPQETGEFDARMELPKVGDLKEEFSRIKPGIKTPYHVGPKNDTVYEPDDDDTRLYIPSEGITLICAMSSHGKTTFLRNLALYFAKGEEVEGDILFFTYEESQKKTKLNLLNTFIGERLSANNFRSLRSFLQGEERFMDESARQTVKDRLSEFEKLLTSGRLRVFGVDDSSKKLTDYLEFYGKKRTIGAVFVDYMQRIPAEGRTADRKEEMRIVAKDLQDFSKKMQIPVILAAQLNRATGSPVRMGSNNIAESVDLTTFTSSIICLWNSRKREDITDDRFGNTKEEKDRFPGFTEGTPGHLYLKVTKDKDGDSGLGAILVFDGNSGKISPNEDGERKKAGQEEESGNHTSAPDYTSTAFYNVDEGDGPWNEDE